MACGTITQKIIESHSVNVEKEDDEVAISVDQTLTQDATGTMAYLQFLALEIPKVKTKLSVSYIDHNTLQTSFENADDHLFLKTVAQKYGIKFSKPGNGICHRVHLERFAKPGVTLLGSDSHTPTAGGVGCLGIGAGGLDVAVAMAGKPFYFKKPKILGVKLTGKLQEWVSGKDIILELLRRLTVKGGVGKIIEYFGPGVKELDISSRATIANMGAELGATSSIFPSDEITREFLKEQQRENDWVELKADKNAEYDEVVEINLNELEPMIALPHSPDNVVKVSEVKGKKINQVCIGSCTNSSLKDLSIVAKILEKNDLHKDVSLVISPGSRQVLTALAENGYLKTLIQKGARILECACGPCIGMGQTPESNGTTLRTFNRNFKGRTGTKNALSYLVSPETAIASAIFGEITNPKELGKFPKVNGNLRIHVDDSMILEPLENPEKIDIMRGPNIKPLPKKEPMSEKLSGLVLLKLKDNVTTDDIMPAGAKILSLRSNIPAISEYVFSNLDKEFVKRAKEKNGGFIVAGENYGQGSSREHAALAPMYLGIKAVIAKSFARIHKANLINFGILPLEFANEKDFERVSQNDELEINARKSLEKNSKEIIVENKTNGFNFKTICDISPRLGKVLIEGGLLNYTRNRS